MQDETTFYAVIVGELYKMTGDQIAEKLRRMSPRTTSDSEYNSWRKSIPVLINVIHQAGLDDLKLVLEYMTPIGGRIDAVLLGFERSSNTPLALVIELKQWSYIGENITNSETLVSVPVSLKDNQYEDRMHPVQQTLTYSKHLKQNHSNIAKGMMKVRCCQYLHNFESKRLLFEGNYEKYKQLEPETFVKAEESRLVEYLRNTFSSKYRNDITSIFLDGEYILGEAGFRGLKEALGKKENAAMIDDQIEVNSKIWRKIKELHENPEKQKLIIVPGEPGTGKTILGFHVLYMYLSSFKGADPISGKCILSLPRSKTLAHVIEGESGVAPVYVDRIPTGRDVVVIDEAHRIENLDQTLAALFRKTKFVVALQDDRQRIRLSEEGSVENFLQFADNNGIDAFVFPLVSQKRAGYLGNYVSNLNKLLYDRADERLTHNSNMELACRDSLIALDNELWELSCKGNRVKWYAPFCWDWSKTTSKKDIRINTDEEVFEKSWNPHQDQYHWYKAETREAFDQVGCIYTAQGLEFDYVGVIWWNDLFWDEKCNDWKVDLNAVRDTQFIEGILKHYGGRLIKNKKPWTVLRNGNSKTIHAFLAEMEADLEEIKELILNIYRVLLTRAKKGTYIWFKDNNTKRHFEKVMGLNNGE